ncbi:MAG: serine/threonine protein kinase [Phycisphaerae bacterium]
MQRSAQQIFLEARGIHGEQRDVFLRGACGGDSGLRIKVEELLKADVDAGNFLSGLRHKVEDMLKADAESGSFAGDDLTVGIGDLQSDKATQIGRYKLLQPIGEGGFGTVWLAEQKEPFRRRVALKIIKLGMDTKHVIARFEAERQALAMMEHPNIAKVLDAGSTETGRPFFVMELVKGVPITEYCDREELDTRSRLELFIKVCTAVQHAHHKGIIHRDLKPGNVLVTMHDGEAVPKVIDFGIAKATSAELTEKTLFTQHGQFIGTPAYMSPEQAEMSGLDIDTRTDVYSLGVLLYELLTGTPPFDPERLRSVGYNKMLDIILKEEPMRPSTRMSTIANTSDGQGKQRIVTRQQGTLFRGDLDWIAMKCLEKDRSRRYETASGLADDIRRHLEGLTISAGPPHTAYRFRKFVSRNQRAVAAVTTLIVLLVLALVGTSYGLTQVLEARNLARQKADEAVRAQQAELTTREELEAANEQVLSLLSKGALSVEESTVVAQAALRMLEDIDRMSDAELRSLLSTLVDINLVGRKLAAQDQPHSILLSDLWQLQAKLPGWGFKFEVESFLDGVKLKHGERSIYGQCSSKTSGSTGLGIDQKKLTTGYHRVTATIQAHIFRTPTDSHFGNGTGGGNWQVPVDWKHARTVQLEDLDFDFTLVPSFPEQYPLAIVDESLAAEFLQGFLIEGLDQVSLGRWELGVRIDGIDTLSVATKAELLDSNDVVISSFRLFVHDKASGSYSTSTGSYSKDDLTWIVLDVNEDTEFVPRDPRLRLTGSRRTAIEYGTVDAYLALDHELPIDDGIVELADPERIAAEAELRNAVEQDFAEYYGQGHEDTIDTIKQLIAFYEEWHQDDPEGRHHRKVRKWRRELSRELRAQEQD